MRDGIVNTIQNIKDRKTIIYTIVIMLNTSKEHARDTYIRSSYRG